jgi:hypothetical protein
MARLATVLNGFTTVGTLQDPWFTAGSWTSYKSFIPHMYDNPEHGARIGRMVTGDEVVSTDPQRSTGVKGGLLCFIAAWEDRWEKKACRMAVVVQGGIMHFVMMMGRGYKCYLTPTRAGRAAKRSTPHPSGQNLPTSQSVTPGSRRGAARR